MYGNPKALACPRNRGNLNARIPARGGGRGIFRGPHLPVVKP